MADPVQRGPVGIRYRLRGPTQQRSAGWCGLAIETQQRVVADAVGFNHDRTKHRHGVDRSPPLFRADRTTFHGPLEECLESRRNGVGAQTVICRQKVWCSVFGGVVDQPAGTRIEVGFFDKQHVRHGISGYRDSRRIPGARHVDDTVRIVVAEGLGVRRPRCKSGPHVADADQGDGRFPLLLRRLHGTKPPHLKVDGVTRDHVGPEVSGAEGTGPSVRTSEFAEFVVEIEFRVWRQIEIAEMKSDAGGSFRMNRGRPHPSTVRCCH